ncbi:MAG: efflux transporter outer membrane subunit [Burkholderiaceae bacterium]|jgi:NodT family efflux transporter outer membrane factor (OMF) lipoprotein|nr:efflux transporter outer membrane subunit [Burkholderiaceae bacterium]
MLTALLAAGCTAVGPDFQPSAPDAPADFAQWHGGPAELLEQRPAPSTAPIPGWPLLKDPALDQLLARATEANADVRTAALRLAESRALRESAGAALAPQLNAAASATRLRLSESSDSTRAMTALLPPAQQAQAIAALAQPYTGSQAGLDFAWEIDLWGRVRRGIEAADAQLDASAALLAQAQWSVQAEAARRYFELRGAQRQLALTHRDIAAAEELLALVRARADGGQATDLDVTRQQTLLADLRARRPPLLAQEAAAANALTLLLAQPPGALQTLLAVRESEDEPPAWPDLSLGLPSDVARRRPDIAQAEALLHAATANTGVAVADFYPRLTLGAHFGLQTLGNGGFGDWGNRTWSIGPGLQLPIFDGGRRRATLTVRRLQQQEAAIAYHQTVLQAWHEIDNALNTYGAERQRNARLLEKETSSRAALLLAQARYQNGLTDFLTELDAQRTLLAARRERADSDTQLGLAWSAVIKALGPEGEAER